MTWRVPENRLSVRQRAVLTAVCRDIGKARYWIQGCAGSGKTLLLIHAIEQVAIRNPKASICFVTFTHSLKDLVRSGLSQELGARVKVVTHTQFKSDKKKFDYVFVDEVQDISKTDLRAIASYAGSLQLAGDPDQSIYKGRATESDINSLLEPRTERLLEVFRLSKLIKDIALSILPRSLLVEGQAKSSDANVQIRLLRFNDQDAEAAWVFEEARGNAKGGYNASAILFSTHKSLMEFSKRVAKHLRLPEPPAPEMSRNFEAELAAKSTTPNPDYREYNKHWEARRVPLAYFGNGNGNLADSEAKPMVYLMTYHSSKGLDFKSVFLPSVNADMYCGASKKELAEDPSIENRLMFVAVTRSRENLYVSFTTEQLHRTLRNLPKEMVVEASPKLRKLSAEQGLF